MSVRFTINPSRILGAIRSCMLTNSSVILKIEDGHISQMHRSGNRPFNRMKKKIGCSARDEHRRTLRSSSSAKAPHVYGAESHLSFDGSKRARRSSARTPVSISPIRCLLLHVQKSIENEGRRHTTSIMDVILDAKQYRTDKLLEAIQCSQIRTWRDYGFIDEDSLDAYWISQAAIWNNVRSVEPAPPQFPVSTERSTALWCTTLDGDPGRDYDHASNYAEL